MEIKGTNPIIDYYYGENGHKLILIPNINFISLDDYADQGFYYVYFTGKDSYILCAETDMPLKDFRSKIIEYWTNFHKFRIEQTATTVKVFDDETNCET